MWRTYFIFLNAAISRVEHHFKTFVASASRTWGKCVYCGVYTHTYSFTALNERSQTSKHVVDVFRRTWITWGRVYVAEGTLKRSVSLEKGPVNLLRYSCGVVWTGRAWTRHGQAVLTTVSNSGGLWSEHVAADWTRFQAWPYLTLGIIHSRPSLPSTWRMWTLQRVCLQVTS